MSTKIYNGYRIVGKSLDEVMGKIFSNKNDLINIIEEKIKREILIETLSNYYDFCFESFFDTKEKSSENSSAMGKMVSNALNNEYDLEKRERKTNDMIDVSICIFPVKKESQNEQFYLIMLFGDKYSKDIVNSSTWNEMKIEEYGYWDNTDQPDELTESEWEERGIFWDEALGKSGVPSHNSFILELKKEYKYNFTYFKDNDELKKEFKESFESFQSEITQIKESLFRYYNEQIKDKVAYRACSVELFGDKKLEDLNKEEQQSLYYKMREYSRNNKFTEEELSKINTWSNNIKIIMDKEIILDNLFEKKEDIINKMKPLFKKSKIKI